MFRALVREGEHVRLPSGRTGIVVGIGEGRRVEVLYDDATSLNDTVLLQAHLLKPLQVGDGPYLGDIISSGIVEAAK